MALHCPATLLVGLPRVVEQLHDPGLVTGYGPFVGAEVDVVSELEALADLHRGERVVVPVDEVALREVAEMVGPRRAAGAGDVLHVEIGDDGWVLAPGLP
ncbi:MAG: hypothetical protein ABIQ61_04150 [Ornithinibacter sp.]